MSETRLLRSETDKMIGGVCGGIAAYLGLDSALVRLAFVVLLFASGIGFPIYIILWIIMPRETTVGKPGSEVIQDNIGDMSEKVTSGMNRVGRAGTVGWLLILLGAYFLFNQFGWLNWLGDILWPVLIIGVGLYFLTRRGR
jgi:phage shock protein C